MEQILKGGVVEKKKFLFRTSKEVNTQKLYGGSEAIIVDA